MASPTALRPLLRPGPKLALALRPFYSSSVVFVPAPVRSRSSELKALPKAGRTAATVATAVATTSNRLAPFRRPRYYSTTSSSSPSSPSNPSSTTSPDVDTPPSTIALGPPPATESVPEERLQPTERVSEETPEPAQQESSTTSSPSPSPDAEPIPTATPPAEPEPAEQQQLPKPTPAARFSAFMDNVQTRFLAGTQTLNELTGYDSIEAIKRNNALLETQLAEAQSALRAARAHYKTTHAARASTQREVTTLLARKDTWSPTDLERFTTMYRQDHELEAQSAEASRVLTEAEDEVSRLGAALNSGMLRRYHEEQIWSDRIRRASTWGTWGLMGVNVLLFLGFQFVAEPWRRKRLVRSIAEGEKGVMDEVRAELAAVRAALTTATTSTTTTTTTALEGGDEVGAASEAVSPPVGEAAAPVSEGVAGGDAEAIASSPWWTASWTEFISDPVLWRPALEDLYSERRIDVSMRDVSVLFLEGAAAGALIAAGVAAVFFRR